MKTLLLSALLLAPVLTFAQNVGIGTTTPDATAALDITATGKGLLIPRLDSATRVGISSPPAGLMVYQTGPARAGFYYYTGAAWVFIPDKARAGDNLGNHLATQALVLNNNPLRLRAATDANHGLTYNSTYDGPLLYGYSGGALGTTTNGTTITPALRWTSANNVSVDLAGTNAGNGPDLSFGGVGYGEGIGSARASGSNNLYGLDLYTSGIRRLTIGNGGTVSVGVAGTNTGTAPDLAFGGNGTGEGIGSARSTGNPNQYGIDFYTGFNKRLSITNTGNVGIGTSAAFSQLANTSANIIAGDGRGGNGGSLTWTANQAGYAAMIYNAQSTSPASGLAVKVAGTDNDINVLDVSAGATQTSAGTALLDVKADGTVVIPGTLTVGSRLRPQLLVHAIQTQAAPTANTTVTLTAALLRLTDNSNATANGTLTLATTNVQEGQQVLVANLDAQNVNVNTTAGIVTVIYGMAARFVYVGGGWLREL